MGITRGLVLAGIAPFLVTGQSNAPRVGEVNFYGLRKVTAEKILSAVNLKPGVPLPSSADKMEDTIKKIPGVILARVETVCCEALDAAVFIGIEERGAPHAAFRSAPAGNAVLPEDFVGAYQQFRAAVQRAASRGIITEDLTSGHSQMDDPESSAAQAPLLSFAAEHLNLLRDVLRNSSVPELRVIAAAAIGYAPADQKLVDDLQYALEDPDEAVRANATGSLKAIAVLASKQPQLGLQISPTWFVEMLHSVVLTDRVESAKALVVMTDAGGGATIDLLRERALPDLAGMARWQTLRYALPPFLLMGRIAGISETELEQLWVAGQREPVIEKALATQPRHTTLK